MLACCDMIGKPMALNVAEQSAVEFLDELVNSISDLNSPKNISSDLIRDLLLDTHSYRTRQTGTADSSGCFRCLEQTLLITKQTK